MSQWWAKVRQLVGLDEIQPEADDTEQLERQPKWSEQSQTSSNQLELPKEPHRRRNESSSLKAAPTTRKPRPIHRSATDTMRNSGTDTDDRGESRAGGHNTSFLESNSEEESSTTRLTRRPSVLTDLIALFRRSSSFGHRRPSRNLHQMHDEEEESDELDDEAETQTMTKERLLLAIRRKKEHINRLRAFPWPMKKKVRTLRIVQRYIKRQQAKVSKFQLYKVEFGRQVKHFGRWLSNIKDHLIPWESKIKHIESHFGSVVSSYFTFLRWILYLNMALTLIITFFIVIPEWLVDSRGNPERLRRNQHIKVMPPNVQAQADELKTVLDFGGFLQYSYIFYGFYSSETILRGGPFPFKVPVAYFIVNLFILGFSLFLILRKMASNARNSKLQDGRTEQYVFSWKVINGWDYSLGNPETAQSLFKANVTKLKESIGEFNVKMKQKMNCMIITRRIFVNIIISAMIVFTAWIIWKASYLDKDTFLKQNAVSIIVSFVTLVFPNLFELIGHLECFHPRFALRVHLARVFVLYVVAYYTLFASLFAMLNSLQTQTITEVTTADAYTYNQPFSIVFNPNSRSNKTYYETVTQRKRYRSRHFRQLAENDTNALDPPPAFTKPPIFTYTTTPAPQPLWTTVQSNFGPFGVGILQPKVLVLPDKKPQKHKTVYETRPIGPMGDWSDSATQGPIPLHYTTSPRRALIKSSRGFYTGDSVCWETTIGQEIVKVVVTDLVLTVFIIMVIDFLRDLWVRYCVLFWCWNLEEGFPGYGEFKISENVLHLIKDQTMVWLGTMFVPLLPVINIIKLVVLMYLRGWAVMSCNVPARQIFRASRSNNFYLILLLVMFLVSTVPLGYVIASIPPSKGCGPFAGQPHFYSILLSSLRENLNQNVVSFLESILSPGFIIPVLLLLMLVIYFMFALIRGLREANSELSEQLTHERTEERYRVYNLAKGADSKTANGLGRTGKQSPEKMGKIAAAALRTPHRSPQRSLKSPTSLDEFSSIHSPSKSPISPRIAAHASFLPSLQSLKEDASLDEEAEDEQSEEAEQKQHLLQKPRGSSILPPPEALCKDVRYDDLPPVKLNWKQKFMVLIGLQDRDKLEAKLRMRQLAETAYAGEQEEPENEKDDADNKQYSSSEHSSDNKTQSEKSSIILPPTTPQVRNSLLEEASSSTNNDYSDQPQAMQRGLRPRIPTPATVIGSPKGRTPSHSPWSRAGSSRGTGGTDEDTGGEPTTIINTGQPAQPQHQRAQSQRRTGLSADRTTPKHLGSPWLLEPEVPARRAFSMNDPKRLQAPFERDLASEASPLMEKSSDEIMEEYKLSPQKRSPPSGPHRKRSSGSNIREYSLDSTPMIYQDQPAKPIPSVEGSYWDHAQKMHVSDDPTRPPSEDASFRDPTPTFGDEHRLRSPLLDMPDDRLSYANPYSSYAAAMCSPVMQQNMANDPLVQRLSQPLPELSATPEPQQMYPIQPTNFYGTPPLGQYPLQIPQPYYAQHSPAAFTPVRARQSTVPRQSSAQPAYYYQQPMTPPSIPQRFFPPPIGENYPMYDHTFSPYHVNRTAPSTPRQLTSPLYQQYYPPMSPGYNTEPRHVPLRADPRNISPGGYITGGSTSPTPELTKPRFRISSSPPRRGKTNYASDSGQGSSDPSVRRWDLRQRGELVSTDSSSPERKSPNRGYSQQQTTV